MLSQKMTSSERRATGILSLIMALRMIGLFMVLPVFSLYSNQLTGATPALIGLALGIYGLAQAICQIPFGTWSDRYGRRHVAAAGLVIFAIGSLIAGFSHSIGWMIIGRTLQGMGAVGSTLLAYIADLTREEQRTKAMAIAGMTIGLSFSIAMVLGPFLAKWFPVHDLFFIATCFGLIAIGLLYTALPKTIVSRKRDQRSDWQAFYELLRTPELAKLNFGIFILHALFTASFIIIPINLLQVTGLSASQQWHIYLPTLIIGFVLSLIGIGFAERRQQIKPFFVSGVALLLISQLLLWGSATYPSFIAIGLTCFFGGFSLLEAFMPSLVSRTAPLNRKGTALGIYSCAQFSGIFVGGALGGYLYGQFHFPGVYILCLTLAALWLIVSLLMQPPRFLVTQLWRLPLSERANWPELAQKLHVIPGMIEVTFDDGIAYLKMERKTLSHPDYQRLKVQVSSP